MEKVMRAISLANNNSVQLQQVPTPVKAEPGHLVIKMVACGINAGDNAFIGGAFPPGSIPVSRYDICGVSGVGTVIETGAGVPGAYKGANVTVYRSLKFSEHIIGTWCEYVHLHYLHCAIIPGNTPMEEYAGSLVNIITPFAFLQQIKEEGHKGIISTAGSSATGIAMLGICLAYNFPLISIVRTEDNKKELEAMGATKVVVQNDDHFKQQLNEQSKQAGTTAIFDGVGGEVLNKIIDVLPNGATIYSYGYLGGKTPLTIHTSILMRGITIKGFGNFRTRTVQDPQRLEQALQDISSIIDMPHFKTKTGKKFTLEEINDALLFSSDSKNGKAVLYPFRH